jgi:hypothetical protein
VAPTPPDELILAVIDGCPRAGTVVMRLALFCAWPDMLAYLRRQGPRGEQLWELYKKHDYSYYETGMEIKRRMWCERNPCEEGCIEPL